MENKINETDIALYHLIFIGNSIKRSFQAFGRAIGRVDNDTELVLYVITSSMILIQVNSFLNEYHQFVRSDDQELMKIINSIKSAVKPALKVINQWKGRHDFRNQVLAHNLRDKMNRSVFERGITSFDIPQRGTDLHVLISCIGMVKDVFESAFREKLALVQEDLDNTAVLKAAARYDGSSFEIAIETVRTEINENIRKLKQAQGAL